MAAATGTRAVWVAAPRRAPVPRPRASRAAAEGRDGRLTDGRLTDGRLPDALLTEYAALAGALRVALRSPEFKVDAVLPVLQARAVRDARAFYDCERGLRIIVVTPHFWGEAWVHGPATRRASVHTLFLERGVVYQYDTTNRAVTVVKNEGWPDALLDVM